jgi:glutamate-1-semialdehyde 2,1-aminomutase
VQINQIGSMMTVFFTDKPVIDFTSAKYSHTGRYAAYFRAVLERGVYIAPSQFEAAFISTAHGDAILEETAKASAEAFHGLV